MKGINTVIYGDTRWHPDINSVKAAFDPDLIPLLFSARAKTVLMLSANQCGHLH